MKPFIMLLLKLDGVQSKSQVRDSVIVRDLRVLTLPLFIIQNSRKLSPSLTKVRKTTLYISS